LQQIRRPILGMHHWPWPHGDLDGTGWLSPKTATSSMLNAKIFGFRRWPSIYGVRSTKYGVCKLIGQSGSFSPVSARAAMRSTAGLGRKFPPLALTGS
jgi:hypothetical protein